MAPPKILPVPYHRQSDPTSCGAACLRMALETIGVVPSPPEAAIYAVTKSPSWGDGSPPDNVANYLKTNGGSPASTVAVKHTTGPNAEDDLIRLMVWSIHDVGVPPIALAAWMPQSTTGDGHWIIVAGYDANRDPTGPADAGCVVSGLEFSNPAKATNDNTYPNHASHTWFKRRYLKPVGPQQPQYHGGVVAVAGGH